MRRLHWQVILGCSLVFLSALLYYVHFMIFRDVHHIFIYLIGDIAFVPIEVLLVTLIIHRLLSEREKRLILEKLNMVIGAFFSEVGTTMLTYLSDFDPNLDKIRAHLVMTSEWTEKEFMGVVQLLKRYDYGVEIKKVDLQHLHDFLVSKRDFLLRLLENPNLLEHESFTDLLRAVFHITEELSRRPDLSQLPDSDLAHLAGDIKRSYVQLIHEWLDYMRYSQKNYPYIFSLAIRTNPFDQNASPVVSSR